MNQEDRTTLAFVILGWLFAGYPLYLLLSLGAAFLSRNDIIGLGIFVFIVGTGTFIGGAKKYLREGKIDTVLDREIKEKGLEK